MALRQPPQQQRRQTQRPASTPQAVSVAHDAPPSGRVEESQEWILFSPVVDEQDEISATSRSQNVTSRFSDVGSLETGVRSDQHQDDGDVTCQGTDIDDDDDDDDAEELDSLDDGLHAFHPPFSLDQSGGAVLPNHDGLGGFLDPDDVQDHLWQFERYNPNRRRSQQRRRSSVQRRFDALDQHDIDRHEERRLRIEKWRLEQSHAVLEEIERETKRRRRRLSVVTAKTEMESGSASASESESFWHRITRRVIKDLMGLDDTTLCVIFGEELAPDSSTTPTQRSPIASTVSSREDRTWEHRLLNRIARELGILAHQLAEHDGAFTTYTSHQSPVETSQPRDIPAPSPSMPRPVPAPASTTSAPLFAPTFPNPSLSPAVEADTSLWGIQEEPRTTAKEPQPTTQDPDQDPNYWERELDVGIVFRYLRSRFSSRPPSPAPQPHQLQTPRQQPGVLPADWASPEAPTASALGTSPESRRRADLIRRHHPLVSHAASVSASRRRESLLLRRPHPLLHLRAASSSCASQSTKRTRSGGSRRYWDFPSGTGNTAGGSVVSVGSVGVEGVMGGWGEV